MSRSGRTLPPARDRLVVLAILAVTFVVTLMITDDVPSGIAAVTALLGAATVTMGLVR